MSNSCKSLRMTVALLAFCSIVSSAFGQSGTGGLRGQVTDPSGASVPAIAVTAVAADGKATEVQTNEQGRYVFANLAAGTYTLRIRVKGFADFNKEGTTVNAGQVQVVDAQLVVALERQQVTVTDTATQVSVKSENNASALVLKGKDLDSLSDDPDELQSQLQALAGPSAGPNGGEIYIDGFTGGQLPLKSAIREIRVNQNPFSAQYDKLGYGRIEILTKPGQDKYHGQGFTIFNESALNSRNPFVSQEPSYHHELMDGSFGGPLGNKASFFLDGGRRNIGTNSIVSAVILDSNLRQTDFSEAVPGPHSNSNFSTRLDYQLSSSNTLTTRYQFWQDSSDNNGIGQFSLASLGFNTRQNEHSVQISNSHVISERAVNDLHFEFVHDNNSQIPQSSDPTLQVIGAFTGGGSSQGRVLDTQDHYEAHDLTSISLGKHYVTFGARFRDLNVWDSSSGNFNGAFTFASLDAYQAAETSLLACKSVGQTTCQVSGASQFTITSGNPVASVNWLDLGLYAEDQWRVRSNMSLNLGLRYETQNSIHDYSDFAPRIGFAWGLGHGKTTKTVLRAGSGLFYDRFGQAQVLQAERLNGANEEQFVVTNPDFYPLIPTLSQLQQLSSNQSAPTVYRLASSLRAPYTVQSALGLERQISKNITASVTYLNSHGVHQFLTRNINAPLPGTYVWCSAGDSSCTPSAGVRPFGDVGNIYQFESDGLFNQNQLISNFSVRLGTKVSVFGFYSLGFANGNTAGVGSFPSNQYDLALDYGRAAYDVRDRVVVGGSFSMPKGFRLSPFMMTSSGTPFNITVGQDLNGDSIFNDRPAFALAGATGSNIVATKWGTFDTAPKTGETTIPINYGTGPGFFEMNLRLSKTFAFGRRAESSSSQAGMQGPPPGGGRGGPPPGGSGLGPRGLSGSGGGPGGPGGAVGSAATNARYSLTFSIGARNVFNNVNLGTPVGQLSSPLFGQSNSLAGFFANGGNRHVDFQAMFSF